MGTLFLVSTPIGNLGDISYRAIEVLWKVELILCEDTRKTQKLLEHYKSVQKKGYPPLLSYNDYNRDRRIPDILMRLTRGEDIALVSDRGTPLVSDPGYKLVQAVLEKAQEDLDMQIDSIPGANAILPALQLSGFPPNKFYFIGFLSKKHKARQEQLRQLPSTTVIVYESPFRIVQTLEDIQEVLGDIPVAVCMELTKLHQKIYRGSAKEVIAKLPQRKIKGEVTLVLGCGLRRTIAKENTDHD
jgi:16S rRNA (cytidine1402-2'-O)-methyltransferase